MGDGTHGVAAWKSRPEPDWTPLEPIEFDEGRSFVSGEPDGDRIRVRYFKRKSDGRLVGFAWFGPGAQGPPGFAHGGSIAAMLDEAIGGAGWLAGHPVLVVRITVDFRDRVPLNTELFFEAWVSKVDGRKVTARARLLGDGDRVLSEGEGLLVVIDPTEFVDDLAAVTASLWQSDGSRGSV